MKHYRKRRLFPRTLSEVVKEATNPLVKQRGKFYTALMRDWPTIIGAERAAYMSPLKVQFLHGSEEATLHLTVSASRAPEVAYMQEQIIEQLARYFGYKAIGRVVLHPAHTDIAEPATRESPTSPAKAAAEMPEAMPRDFRAIFERLQRHLNNK